jgi:hypothetical protein
VDRAKQVAISPPLELDMGTGRHTNRVLTQRQLFEKML